MIDPISFVWIHLAWIVAGFIFYLLLIIRLADFVQPIRLRLAELGEDTLVSCQLSKEDRKQIHFYLDHAYSVWPAVIMAIYAPLAAIPVIVLQKIKGPPRFDDVRKRMARLSCLFGISLVAANPLFGILVLVEFAIIAAVVILVTASPLMLKRALISLIGAEALTVPPWMRQAV